MIERRTRVPCGLVKMQIQAREVWGDSPDPAFLRRSQWSRAATEGWAGGVFTVSPSCVGVPFFLHLDGGTRLWAEEPSD